MEDKLLELCNLWKRASQRRVATQNALKVAKQEDDLAKQELDEIANELLVEMMIQDVPSVNFEGLTFSQGTG
jgi:phosphoribosylformylglycinamidine (FGAM) synthase PurS component